MRKMKIEEYLILSILILFTNFGFGQDSLFLNKNSNKTKVLNGNIRGLNLNEKDSNKIYTIYVIKNKYSLNKEEINIALDSICNKKKAKRLLKNYNRKNNEFLIFDKNILCYYKILNNNNANYKTKRNLLFDKIEYDDKTKEKKVLSRGNDFLGASYFSKPIEKVKEIYSKKQATETYINKIRQDNINFSQALFIIDGIIVEKDILLKNKKIEIRQISILSKADGPALYGSHGRNGVIIITTN